MSAPPLRCPRGDPRGCWLNLLLKKWKQSKKKKKKAAGKDKSSDKKVQTKGKRETKRIQAEVVNQEIKDDLPGEKRTN